MRRKRRPKWLVEQRKIEGEFKKKYPEALSSRGGSLLPPTIWNYRGSLTFVGDNALDGGQLQQLLSPLGDGNFRTNPAKTESE